MPQIAQKTPFLAEFDNRFIDFVRHLPRRANDRRQAVVSKALKQRHLVF